MRTQKYAKKAPRRRSSRRSAPTGAAQGAVPTSDRWISMFAAGRQLVMAALDLAETAVAHVPEEREQVRRVRALIEARGAGATPPNVDLRDIAFTIGLVADLTNSDFEQPGISALLVELLPLPRLGRECRRTPSERRAQPRTAPHTVPAICRLCLDEYQF